MSVFYEVRLDDGDAVGFPDDYDEGCIEVDPIVGLLGLRVCGLLWLGLMRFRARFLLIVLAYCCLITCLIMIRLYGWVNSEGLVSGVSSVKC